MNKSDPKIFVINQPELIPVDELSLAEKDRKLRSLIASYDSLIVAYSGGVDSTFLVGVAHEVLGEKSIAVTSRSPSVAPEELEAASALALKTNAPTVLRNEALCYPEKNLGSGAFCFGSSQEKTLMQKSTKLSSRVLLLQEN